MSQCRPPKAIITNPLHARGIDFREDCSERGHALYSEVRDWMEDHGGPPELDGDADEQQMAVQLAESRVYLKFAKLVWTEADAAEFERDWATAIEVPAFRAAMELHFPTIASFLDRTHERQLGEGAAR